MAIEQNLTLTQLESEQSNLYRVRILWTSKQTPPTYNSVSHIGYLYYSVNNGSEAAVSVKYSLPPRKEQIILDTVVEIPVTETVLTFNARTWMDTHLSAGVIEMAESLEIKPLASTVTATDTFIGSESLVKIHRGAINHTHSVRFAFGSQSGYLTEDGGISAEEVYLTGDEIPFLVPESFYAEIPNAAHIVCQLSCTTYLDGVQIGDVQESSFIAYVNEDVCSPDVTGRIYDVKEATVALTGYDQTLIRYHSTARCTIFPQPKCCAAVAEKWINGTQTDGDTLDIPNVDQERVQFGVTDSRGFRAECVNNLTLIPYTHLTLAPKVWRDDPTSGNATLEYYGLYFRGSFGAVENALKFEYKVSSGEYVTAENVNIIVGTNSYTVTVTLTGLDYRKVHHITARVSDRLETVEKTVTLKKGIPVFDWGENDFHFNVPVTVAGTVSAEHFLVQGMPLINAIYPVGSVYITIEDVYPGDLFGGAWELLYQPDANVIGYQWKRVS